MRYPKIAPYYLYYVNVTSYSVNISYDVNPLLKSGVKNPIVLRKSCIIKVVPTLPSSLVIITVR